MLVVGQEDGYVAVFLGDHRHVAGLGGGGEHGVPADHVAQGGGHQGRVKLAADHQGQPAPFARVVLDVVEGGGDGIQAEIAHAARAAP